MTMTPNSNKTKAKQRQAMQPTSNDRDPNLKKTQAIYTIRARAKVINMNTFPAHSAIYADREKERVYFHDKPTSFSSEFKVIVVPAISQS